MPGNRNRTRSPPRSSPEPPSPLRIFFISRKKLCMSYQSLIVNAERIAVGSGLQQENIFGMIDHNTHFRFPHFSILYLSFFQQYKFTYVKSQNILLFILVKFTTCFCEKCTKRGISIYADWKCLFFVLLFPFFLQLRKFSIMTFSASASVMPSVLSFNSCSSLIRPIAASWMIAASTCFAWISGIDPTWA